MYKKILVALENGPADQRLLPHISQFAAQTGAALLLLHVADGWAARNFDQLALNESDEMKTDRSYLDSTAARLRATGLRVETALALGNPPDEIVKAAASSQCDLIHGSTIDKVRHNTTIPLLVVSAVAAKAPPVD